MKSIRSTPESSSIMMYKKEILCIQFFFYQEIQKKVICHQPWIGPLFFWDFTSRGSLSSGPLLMLPKYVNTK